jgi:hypothetical protein
MKILLALLVLALPARADDSAHCNVYEPKTPHRKLKLVVHVDHALRSADSVTYVGPQGMYRLANKELEAYKIDLRFTPKELRGEKFLIPFEDRRVIDQFEALIPKVVKLGKKPALEELQAGLNKTVASALETRAHCQKIRESLKGMPKVEGNVELKDLCKKIESDLSDLRKASKGLNQFPKKLDKQCTVPDLIAEKTKSLAEEAQKIDAILK